MELLDVLGMTEYLEMCASVYFCGLLCSLPSHIISDDSHVNATATCMSARTCTLFRLALQCPAFH